MAHKTHLTSLDEDFQYLGLDAKMVNKINKKKKDLDKDIRNIHGNVKQEISPIIPHKIKELVAKTDNQKLLLSLLETTDVTIALGSAGTGKTFVTVGYCAHALLKNEFSKLIVTRPNIPAAATLGLTTGSTDEKFQYWLVNVIEVLKEFLGTSRYELFLKNGKIEFVPLELMRGRSFNDALIIVDELQNLPANEMKMLLTRMGQNSKYILNGDIGQCDLKEKSGLELIENSMKVSENLREKIGIVKFGIDDVVRSGIVKDWLVAFDKLGV